VIGVYDSGLGGLTVLAALRAAGITADAVYFADQAHVPYGDKSDAELHALLAANLTWLRDHGADAVVMGCNTSCAVASRAGWPAVVDSAGLPAVRTPVSIVIPCYNEELILPYLSNTLASVREQFAQYALTFIFVDDHSTDGTWAALEQIFGGQPDCILVRHATNRGVAAGILTGIQRANTDIVCSMDCDCTYDPHELAKMIPLLSDGVDMVTASPYHANGTVRNVPRWRLGLSMTLSRMYRLVLHQQLATYTSCFRVYRRSAMVGMRLQHDGFLGVAEMLGRLDLGGARITEYPATLEVRMLGRSKMKIVRTIAGHVGLLARLAAMRLSRKR